MVLAGDRAKDEEAPQDEAMDSQPMPDEEIARWESIGLVRLVVETLDERSKEIVRMRFDEDLSYGEIAARLELKVGHVGYLLHHALKAMAVELEKTEVAR
jgi:RNA polymerase sigma factor (sigma-70 family)